MGSLSGSIQRPLVPAAAVIAASVSADVSERFSSLRSLVRGSESEQKTAASVQDERSLWVSQISASKLVDLSFVSRIRGHVPNVDLLALNPSCNLAPYVTSLSALRSVYQAAEFAKASKPAAFTIGDSLVVHTDGICLRIAQSICLIPRVVHLRRIEPLWFCLDGFDQSRSI